jgi:serine/threonine-protein kinase
VIPVAVVKRLMSDVLHGLHAAHEATDVDGERLGVIHRDVSAGNILVGTDGHARLLDFGIARAAGRLTRTQTGIVKGKLMYLAPEQLRQKPLTRRTDVYGAAVVMWQALTGRRLFDGPGPGDVALQILERAVPRPSELNEEVDAALDDIVMRGLQRAPELRWRSADHMAEAIEATGGLASHRAVGDWVQSAMPLELAERRALRRAVERADSEEPGGLPRQSEVRAIDRRLRDSSNDGPTRLRDVGVSALASGRGEGAPARPEPRRLLRPTTVGPRRRAPRWRWVAIVLGVVATSVLVAVAVAQATRWAPTAVTGCRDVTCSANPPP